MTSQDIVVKIRRAAKKLGRTPRMNELPKLCEIGHYHIRRYFGNYARTLRVCELEPTPSCGRVVGAQELFEDWARIARELKKIPSRNEYLKRSKYSAGPIQARFGSWVRVANGMLRYAENQRWAGKWRDVLEMIAKRDQADTLSGKLARTAGRNRPVAATLNRPVYGRLMHRGPLTHGPTNENGVLYLFGAMAEKLGFVMNQIQTAFPDGEGMRYIGNDRWQRVRIEFEYESRNFVIHGHNPNECDLIVCWLHNWPRCPLEVVELSRVMAGEKMPPPPRDGLRKKPAHG